MSKKVNIEVIKGYAGLKKVDLLKVEPKDLKDIKKTLEAGLKDITDTKLIKLVNTRLTWINEHMEALENTLLAGMFENEETEENEAQQELSLDMENGKPKEEEPKKVSSRKITKNKGTGKPKDTANNKPKENTNNKPEEPKTVMHLIPANTIPDIAPQQVIYVTIDDNEQATFKLIYASKEENKIVLLDDKGVIACDYNSFVNKELVRYNIGSNRYAFDIVQVFTK